MTWTEGDFKVAVNDAPREFHGWTKDGLGLFAVPRLFGSDVSGFVVVHLNTGHGILGVPGILAGAMAIGDLLLTCGDWDYTGLDGWQNQSPDLLDNLRALAQRLPVGSFMLPPGEARRDENAAREILTERW
jgi:hypothetical protein